VTEVTRGAGPTGHVGAVDWAPTRRTALESSHAAPCSARPRTAIRRPAASG